MSKSSTDASNASVSESAGASRRDGSWRETFEPIAIAMIFVLLVRTFEVQAFVIPTGSMAGALYGQHKDVVCPKCGSHFAAGASTELDREFHQLLVHRIHSAICPDCRHECNIYDEPAFKGDRIFVSKFPYEFGSPDRWDVVVFHFPENPSELYIKRLVGLPGESLKIERGDVYVQSRPDGPWRILRKDSAGKLDQLQVPVYDNANRAPALAAKGWPERWSAMRTDESLAGTAGWVEDKSGWQPATSGRAFSLEGRRRDYQWLRYRHMPPSTADWKAIDEGNPLAVPRAQLITDFCAFNGFSPQHANSRSPVDLGTYWVGDLGLTFDLTVHEAHENASVVVELNEGVRRYRCRLDLQSGTATLFYLDSTLGNDAEQVVASVETGIVGPGQHQIGFTNADDALTLAIDGETLVFGDVGAYAPAADPAPQDADLVPVGIAARNASVSVDRLLLTRDTYYRSDSVDDFGNYRAEFTGAGNPASVLGDLVETPDRWWSMYDRHARSVTFDALSADEFFMLGDNSPQSQDSRLWSNTRHAERRHAVPRSALVGKAFCTFWPHGVPFMNDGKGFALPNIWPLDKLTFYQPQVGNDPYPKYRVPFYPQMNRMGRIR